ncbi:MAG: hypothetical protein RLY14_2465 [Planctomycetota bacterium]|jgi:hypothetical protein
MDGTLTSKKQNSRKAVLPQWRLHESTRKLACRALVLFFGLLPTLLTLIWCGLSFLPLYRQWQGNTWQKTLEQQLGFDIEIFQALSLGPRQVQLQNLELFNPETHQAIASIDSVLLTRFDDGWEMQVGTVELQSSEFLSSAKQLHDRLLCVPREDGILLRLNIDQLRIQTEIASPQVFSEFQVEWSSHQNESLLSVRAYHNGDKKLSDKVLVRATRSHESSRPRTQWLFRSGSSEISATLLSAIWPGAARLGENACFNGDVRAEIGDESMTFSVDGRLDRVSLDELTRKLPQGLAGSGRIDAFRATVRDHQLVQASGQLTVAGGGSLHRTWLLRAGSMLGLRLRDGLYTKGPTFVHFDQMVCQFDWDRDGLQLQGRLPPIELAASEKPISGVIAIDGLGPLFADAGTEPQQIPRANSWQVVQWLTEVPDAAATPSQVMAAQEVAVRLGRHLPSPAPPRPALASPVLQASQSP